ncbi:MAG: RES family NAD+ phosphorylase [Steroidobacteraceae bacterium]
MIDFWRLYRAAHGPGLDGAGGLHAAGRWHRLGRRVVYFGASPAIVVLEKLAHVDPDVLPGDLLLGRFAGEASIESATGPLNVSDLTACRALGERFLDAGGACGLRVPSAVLPEESHYLVNALHPHVSKIRLVSERVFFFDQRLIV